MLRTEYYIVNHVKEAIRVARENGLIDYTKDELSFDDCPDSFYVSVLKFVESFLNRNKCDIDALEFFEKYEEIRKYILDAISNPDEADVPSAVLASTEFGKQIARCKSAYHIFLEEFKIYESEEYQKQIRRGNSPFNAYGQMNPWAKESLTPSFRYDDDF